MSPNPPPGLMLPGVAAAPTVTEAGAVVALVIRREVLGSAGQAARTTRADRPASTGLPQGRPARGQISTAAHSSWPERGHT
jgi:hypothetical protein